MFLPQIKGDYKLLIICAAYDITGGGMPHIQSEISKEDFKALKMLSLENSISIKQMVQEAVLFYISVKKTNKDKGEISETHSDRSC